MRKMIFFLAVCVLIISDCIFPVYAHPGGTDSRGGHYNHSTGEYHYHHGYPEHDHYDMNGDGSVDCPYDFDDKTGSGSNTSDLSSSYTNGYTKGKEIGYESGYQDGQNEMKILMEEKLHSEVKAATRNSYLVSLFYGVPLVLFISDFFSRRKFRKRENELVLQVNNLTKELRSVKNTRDSRSTTVKSTTSPALHSPPIIKTVYISKSGKKYHYKYRCGNATTAISIEDLPSGFEPCRNCAPKNTVTHATSKRSSFISHVNYQNGTLILEFTTGAKYSYYNVPESLYKEMLSAPSWGKFYHERIKDQYPYI